LAESWLILIKIDDLDSIFTRAGKLKGEDILTLTPSLHGANL
jgi:hypothetical protein